MIRGGFFSAKHIGGNDAECEAFVVHERRSVDHGLSILNGDREERGIGEGARRLAEGVVECVVYAVRIRGVPRAQEIVRGGPEAVAGGERHVDAARESLAVDVHRIARHVLPRDKSIQPEIGLARGDHRAGFGARKRAVVHE